MGSTARDVLCKWSDLLEQYPEYRVGQALFQALYLVRPDLASRLQMTDADPFHDDTRVGVAVAWLYAHQDEDPLGETGR